MPPKEPPVLPENIEDLDEWLKQVSDRVEHLIEEGLEEKYVELENRSSSKSDWSATGLRCSHCRSKLPDGVPYHCPVCGLTVSEKVPEEPYTIEMRITHNPSGQMLLLKEASWVKSNIENVDLRRLLGPFSRRLKALLDRYPDYSKDLEVPKELESFTITAIRKWCKEVRERIRAKRDKIKTVSGEEWSKDLSLKSMHDAKRVMAQAISMGYPDSNPPEPPPTGKE